MFVHTARLKQNSILGLLPLGVNNNTAAMVRLFQDTDEAMVGVCPLTDQVFRTFSVSEYARFILITQRKPMRYCPFFLSQEASFSSTPR